MLVALSDTLNAWMDLEAFSIFFILAEDSIFKLRAIGAFVSLSLCFFKNDSTC